MQLHKGPERRLVIGTWRVGRGDVEMKGSQDGHHMCVLRYRRHSRGAGSLHSPQQPHWRCLRPVRAGATRAGAALVRAGGAARAAGWHAGSGGRGKRPFEFPIHQEAISVRLHPPPTKFGGMCTCSLTLTLFVTAVEGDHLLFDGAMFPSRSKSSSPSLGVKCATTQVACLAASGVQAPSIIPARSTSGQTVCSSSGCRYRLRSTRTGPTALV